MVSPLPRKRLYIKTYGCQMNVYDSERMAELLAPLGYEATDRPEGADLVVLNTCTVTSAADDDVRQMPSGVRGMEQGPPIAPATRSRPCSSLLALGYFSFF